MLTINCAHSHFMPGIDDGVKTMEEAIKGIKLASNAGIKKMILTPHYIENSKWACNNQKKEEIFDSLVNLTNELDITLYLANEVYLTDNVLDLLNDNEIKTINNHIFIELPVNSKLNGYEDILYTLKSEGYTPVIVHPERYKYDLNYDYLLSIGVLFQGNYLSLFNKYGRTAKKKLKYLLKNNYIHLIGSDSHRVDTDYKLKELEKVLIKKLKLTNSYIEDITINNFNKLC